MAVLVKKTKLKKKNTYIRTPSYIPATEFRAGHLFGGLIVSVAKVKLEVTCAYLGKI